MLTDQQFDDLLAAYLDGDASQESVAALHDAVQQSEQLRTRFQEATRLHVLIHETCKEQLELDFLRTSIADSESPKVTSLAVRLSVAATVLMALATGFLYLRFSNGTATRDVVGYCVNVSGSNDLQVRREEEWRALRPDDVLRLGDSVRCGENAQAMLRLSEGSLLSLDSSSEVTFADQHSEVRLKRGKVLFEIAKRVGDMPPFRVHTRGSTVDVLGTVFELAEWEDTKLEVYEGRVKLTRHRDNAKVEVTEQQMVTTGTEQLKPTDLDSPDLDSITLLPSDDTTLDRGRPEARGLRLKVEGERRVVYLRFDIPEVPGIQNARLRLTQDVDAGSGTLRFYVGSHADWTESDANESTVPSRGREVAQHRGVVSRGQIVEVDVSSAITQAGPMTLIMTLDTDLENDIWFSAREGKHPPQLLLTHLPAESL